MYSKNSSSLLTIFHCICRCLLSCIAAIGLISSFLKSYFPFPQPLDIWDSLLSCIAVIRPISSFLKFYLSFPTSLDLFPHLSSPTFPFLVTLFSGTHHQNVAASLFSNTHHPSLSQLLLFLSIAIRPISSFLRSTFPFPVTLFSNTHHQNVAATLSLSLSLTDMHTKIFIYLTLSSELHCSH